jgi:hypothetical protein
MSGCKLMCNAAFYIAVCDNSNRPAAAAVPVSHTGKGPVTNSCYNNSSYVDMHCERWCCAAEKVANTALRILLRPNAAWQLLAPLRSADCSCCTAAQNTCVSALSMLLLAACTFG